MSWQDLGHHLELSHFGFDPPKSPSRPPKSQRNPTHQAESHSGMFLPRPEVGHPQQGEVLAEFEARAAEVGQGLHVDVPVLGVEEPGRGVDAVEEGDGFLCHPVQLCQVLADQLKPARNSWNRSKFRFFFISQSPGKGGCKGMVRNSAQPCCDKFISQQLRWLNFRLLGSLPASQLAN